MAQTYRWGIIGIGNIARSFARGLTSVPTAQLYAIASRSAERCAAFRADFPVQKQYNSYQALCADPNVDIVYVATRHCDHRSAAFMCIEAGKPVLCEKPFTVNSREAREVIDAARSRRVFIMEAMWTRFFPLMVRLREMLRDGAIGNPRMLHADFGFRANFDPAGRLFDPKLVGGALLDVGIYPLSLASMIFGPPQKIVGLAHLGETNVDEQAAMLLGYRSGELAVLSTAIRTQTPQEADILGEEGNSRIHERWWMPRAMTLRRPGKDDELIEIPFEGNGYNYEALEVMRCLDEGLLESPIMPLDETFSLMQTMDILREQWGLRYPCE